MTYIDSLFELIRSKQELTSGNVVSVSLGEIADAWKRENIWSENNYISSAVLISKLKHSSKFINPSFLHDIVSVLERLAEQKGIHFKYAIRDLATRLPDEQPKVDELTGIISLSSIHDKIILQTKGEIAQRKQVDIFINKEIGVYRNKKLSYPLKGKRFRLVMELYRNKNLGANVLGHLYNGNNQLLSKEIKSINQLFISSLKVKVDLITHLPTGGFKLNRDIYNIKEKTSS
jgi:hypothetical protein